MSAKAKIQQTLQDNGFNPAGQIFKGYEASTLETGWHFIPFNGQPWYLGQNVRDAVDTIEATAEARKFV